MTRTEVVGWGIRMGDGPSDVTITDCRVVAAGSLGPLPPRPPASLDAERLAWAVSVLGGDGANYGLAEFAFLLARKYDSATAHGLNEHVTAELRFRAEAERREAPE